MRAILDLVVVPGCFAVAGGLLFWPWGVVIGAAVGLYAGASFGTASMEDPEGAGFERELAERDRRIAELEARVEALEEE